MAILKGNNQHNNLVGSIYDDTIYGYGGDDVLVGDAGNDVLKGGAGADVLVGGDGNDVLDGGLGVDKLMGGTGNDSLKVNDLNGDEIDGGAGMDNLQIGADNQLLDLRNIPNLSGIETIRLADNHSTLIVNPARVVALSDTDTLKVDASDGSNTVKMYGGWTDAGVVDGYHMFTKGKATLQVNSVITDIQILPTFYKISDPEKAAHVGDIFDSGVQEITIDFHGKSYNSWDLDSIDLKGFGLEDKLIIALRDGIAQQGGLGFSTIHRFGYGRSANYIYEYRKSFGSFGGSALYRDRVSWRTGESEAKLISEGRGGISTPTWIHGSVQLTGLAAGLPSNQFVFV